MSLAWKHFRNSITRYGIREAVLELFLAKAAQKLQLRVYVAFSMFPFSSGERLPEARSWNIRPWSPQPDDALEVSQDFVEWADREKFLGLGAFSDANTHGPASYCFFSRIPTAVTPRLQFHFPAHDAYAFKAFTRPESRGKGALGAILAFARAPQSPLGAGTIHTVILRHNLASIRAFEKVGFRRSRTWTLSIGSEENQRVTINFPLVSLTPRSMGFTLKHSD